VPDVFLVVCIVVLANLVASVAVANYAATKGFPFLAILIASVFVGFPLVLLAVALMAPRRGFDRI
jgi:zinc transporter ZupT